MSLIDWIVLAATILSIVVYGVWKSRGSKNINNYLLGDQSLPWYTVGFSVMATQASAITFLSAPGQAYSDGMRFVQFYFGLPLAMIVLCITFVPIFHKLKVFTAYEYLEQRFDLKTRALTAFLFLIQRAFQPVSPFTRRRLFYQLYCTLTLPIPRCLLAVLLFAIRFMAAPRR